MSKERQSNDEATHQSAELILEQVTTEQRPLVDSTGWSPKLTIKRLTQEEIDCWKRKSAKRNLKVNLPPLTIKLRNRH